MYKKYEQKKSANELAYERDCQAAYDFKNQLICERGLVARYKSCDGIEHLLFEDESFAECANTRVQLNRNN